MISLRFSTTLRRALDRQAAVALLGPRQVGKTTLALALGEQVPSIYLDLEAPADRAKLHDVSLYLSRSTLPAKRLEDVIDAPDDPLGIADDDAGAWALVGAHDLALGAANSHKSPKYQRLIDLELSRGSVSGPISSLECAERWHGQNDR